MSETPQTKFVAEQALKILQSLPTTGPITMQHAQGMHNVIALFGLLFERLERDLSDCQNQTKELREKLAKAEERMRELEQKINGHLFSLSSDDEAKTKLRADLLAERTARKDAEAKLAALDMALTQIRAGVDALNKEKEQAEKERDEYEHQVRELKSPEYWMQVDKLTKQRDQARECLKEAKQHLSCLLDGTHPENKTSAQEFLATTALEDGK